MAAATLGPRSDPAVPDYLADPNAVLNDSEAAWRYGKAPDYSKTRTYFEQSKLGTRSSPFFFSLGFLIRGIGTIYI